MVDTWENLGCNTGRKVLYTTVENFKTLILEQLDRCDLHRHQRRVFKELKTHLETLTTKSNDTKPKLQVHVQDYTKRHESSFP
jgi:hypothetical protein